MSEPMPHESLGSGSAPDPNAANAGKRRLSGVPLLIVAIGVVLFVQALFVLSYIEPFTIRSPTTSPSGSWARPRCRSRSGSSSR